MSAPGGWRRSRTWRALRPLVAVGLILACYAILRAVFAHVVGSGGFLTPSGSPGMGLVALAFAMVAARIVVLVGVPLFVTYRVVRRVLGGGRSASADEDPEQPAPPPWRPGTGIGRLGPR